MLRFSMRRQRISLAGCGETIDKNGGLPGGDDGLVITVVLGAFVGKFGC